MVLDRFWKGDKYAPLRAPTLAEQLPYFEFEMAEDSVFRYVHLLQDGSLGIAWKTLVPSSYSQDSGEAITCRELQTFIENVPDGFELQIIITSTNSLERKLESYLAQGVDNDRGRLVRQSRAEKLMDAGRYGYPVSARGYTKLRDTYMVICLRTSEQQERFGAIGHILGAIYQVSALLLNVFRINPTKVFGEFIDGLLKTVLAEFQEAVITAESTLNQMFQIERMDLRELKEHYWTALAPSYREPGQKVTIDPYLDFTQQCFPLPLEQDHDIIKVGSDYHGVIMLAMMPDAVLPDYLGQLRLTLPSGYTFFCNIAQANQMLEKVSLTLSAALRNRVATMFSREEAAIVNQEASEVRSRMVGGRKILYAQVGMIVHGKSRAEVEERLLRVNSTFKKLSVVPDIEKTMALSAISYSWPLVWRNRYTKPFARTRRVLSDDLTELLPIHGHWTGHKTGQSVYVNRHGELTFFDHCHPEFVNWHYAITGTSGSGKSVAVVDLTLQLLASGIKKQYLLTIKDDYDRFAGTLGKLIVIDLDRQDSCINPFGGELSKHRLQQWTTALELMVQGGRNTEASPEDRRLLEQVMQYAYEIVPEGDVLRPTWIREAFQRFPYTSADQRQVGLQNMTIIGSYCSDGVYGRLFDGPPSVTEDDGIVVFNLQNVLSEQIADVIVNAVFTLLDNIMYSGNRSEKKHLLVDEMISMISSRGGQNVANQLKRAFRTYRSLNCMCGIASQNEEDLTTDVGAAIIGNITKRMILKPRREMIPLLMQSLGLKSERHAANIESLNTSPGFYSEFYLMSPHGEVVCRLILDKLTYALATTTPDDVAEINRLTDEFGGDRWLACVEFSKRYPQGVRAAQRASQNLA